MFTVYHSNQLDVLKQLIVALIQDQPLSDPFAPEVILVQSPGMAQWLTIELAQQFGIAANIEFPLPATFIWHLFTQVIPDIPKESAFSKDAMAWKLMWLLPQMLDRSEFAALAHYLQHDNDKRKHYQLAARIADLYDQYLVYRPQWLQYWEKGELVPGLGEAQQWQAPLWVALKNYTDQLGQPPWHRANLYQRFIKTLVQMDTLPQGLPKRVFICGISALPPIYLDALKALGQHIDVHLMFTNPCRYYWGDIQDYGFLAKLQTRKRRQHIMSCARPLPADDMSHNNAQFRDAQRALTLFNDKGEQQLSNPLLASWGKLGRDHLYLLAQREPQEVDAFVSLEQETLLQRIQRDILELEDHTQQLDSPALLTSNRHKRLLKRNDHSISIHQCHSPQREVEVLHDRLLDMFASQADLTARDVIVMVADIDSYTPFIQAVFGNAPAERYLPFAISDRSARQAHPVIQAFLALLELPTSRFTTEQILALLDVPALSRRFAINEEGLQRLRRWVTESGIRWGLDDDAVLALALPKTGQHTWQFGLTRMLLGYAMDSRHGDWQGVLPYDETRGMVVELVGQLAELLAVLHHWRICLSEMHTLAEWQPLCHAMLDDLFSQDAEIETVLALIEQQWLKVVNYGLQACYPDAIPLSILRDEMTSRLERERISQRFLAGSINFCTLMPMRSIPFKVVCLLGMNDGVYPRSLTPLAFDLMAGQTEKGDRSRRDDDRYLFLEALISAQQQLYISYIGRSVQDNSPRYPSVLVSELLEYIAQSHYLPGDEGLDVDMSAERVMQHLQSAYPRVPFAPENYHPENHYQSYASAWLPAALGQGEAHPDFAAPLSEESVIELSLDRLLRFYRHPVRAFFQLRLGVNFIMAEETTSNEEPFILDGLEKYQLNQLLLNRLVEGDNREEIYRRVRAAGALPFGAFGEIFWQKQYQELEALAEQVREQRQVSHSMEVDCHIAGIHITGWLAQVQKDGLLHWRPAELNASDGITFWIEHLFYCLHGGEGNSRYYGKGKSLWQFTAISPAQAESALRPIIEGYKQGMNQPLLLLPKSSWAWIKSCFDPQKKALDTRVESQNKAHEKLLSAWLGEGISPGEAHDPYIQRVIRTLDSSVIAQIQHYAQCYYLPLLQHHVE